MKLLFRCRAVLLLFSALSVCLGQNTNAPQTPPAAKSTKTAPQKPAQPKLDARQAQAVDILKSVESDLGRFSPEMQTYLLQDMAHAYKKLDRARQVALL